MNEQYTYNRKEVINLQYFQNFTNLVEFLLFSVQVADLMVYQIF
jgi:hypothetical protein